MTFLHAAWALLNLILIVGAFVISYRNYRDFSERFGCLASALLILAVVSTCNGGRNKAVTSPTNFFYADTVYSADKGPHKERRIVVYGDDLYKITQSVGVSPVHNTDSLRLESTVTVSGLTLGTR
ncbi:hypothetical protein [Spirosoma sp. KUDC1026]|uniref:hypothetical protein n=1 Tax=Spirosoma sp. KUDC1026 TaxID=2745947 RepID=UPI00159BEC03|nr:hypothetical protein [Spirosoma sp. KUDC1026]QKZ12464.1 hypothetical protein HU175_07415 [Spirosoma sp. KUDC1026]